MDNGGNNGWHVVYLLHVCLHVDCLLFTCFHVTTDATCFDVFHAHYHVVYLFSCYRPVNTVVPSCRLLLSTIYHFLLLVCTYLHLFFVYCYLVSFTVVLIVYFCLIFCCLDFVVESYQMARISLTTRM